MAGVLCPLSYPGSGLGLGRGNQAGSKGPAAGWGVPSRLGSGDQSQETAPCFVLSIS